MPHSYFLNLETLYEDAVRQVAREVCSPVVVSRGVELAHPMFKELSDRYVADPDFVVAATSATPIVADCKYKQLDRYPGHSDVYQLTAHCAALGSRLGLLVYPGDTYSSNLLGTTVTGTRVYWATVRPATLREDLAAVLGGLDTVGDAGAPPMGNGS